MNGKKRLISVVVAVVVLAFLTTAPTSVFARTYNMSGKISAIDKAYNTVVIQVPMGSKMFTVAGPLAPDARITKDMKTVGLNDFMVGEHVSVKWHSTPQGHVIDRLAAK